MVVRLNLRLRARLHELQTCLPGADLRQSALDDQLRDRARANMVMADLLAAAPEYFGRLLEGLASQVGFRMDTPWRKLPAAAQKAVLHGIDATDQPLKDGVAKLYARDLKLFGYEF